MDSQQAFLVTLSQPVEILKIDFPELAHTPHIDVLSVNETAEGISIEEIRSVQHWLTQRPIELHQKYVLFHHFEQASPVVQNALLKTLEEPPVYARLFLLTLFPNTLLDTIQSRVIADKKYHSDFLMWDQSISWPENLDIPDMMEWGSEQLKQRSGQEIVAGLMKDQVEKLEQTPSKQQINRLKLLEQAYQMIQANIKPQTALEWLFVKSKI